VAGILVEKVFKQYRGLPANEDRVNELVPQLEAKLDVYEAILSKQKYLAGDVRFFVRNRRSNKKVANEQLVTLYSRSPSQIYSIVCMVASSLNTSSWGIWTSVQMSRGKRYICPSLGVQGF